MKIYIVAAISNQYMIPVDHPAKIYKSKQAAEKARTHYLKKYPHKADGTKVLEADNWHEPMR